MKKHFDDIFVRMTQIGLVTPYEEADQMVENMKNVFELTDDQVTGGHTARHANTIYRGEVQTPPPAVRMDFFSKFPLEMEFLSPVDGNSAWMEYHKAKDRGIHHLCFDVNSHEDAMAYLKEKGIEPIHIADSPRGEGLKFAYYDSYKQLGFYIETFNTTEMELKKKTNQD
jgi:hypothetical protein